MHMLEIIFPLFVTASRIILQLLLHYIAALIFTSAIGNVFSQLHTLFCILVSAEFGSRIFHAHLKKVMLVI